MVSFIAEQRGVHSVENICKILPIAPSTYYEHARRAVNPGLLPVRAQRDAVLLELIEGVWEESKRRYGSRKVWHALLKGSKKTGRKPVKVARCTVERLMRAHGLQGVSRGRRRVFTTSSSEAQDKPLDLVERNFTPDAPNKLWVADLTYVRTLIGFVYVAFVTDAFAKRIVGWQVSSSMTARLVLDALQQALYEREIGTGLVHHSDHGVQYLSIAYSEALLDAGIAASVGSKGDAFDNALAETINGLYKAEVINHLGPWHGLADVERATMEWVHWFNTERSYENLGYKSPAEYEMTYHQGSQAAA